MNFQVQIALKGQFLRCFIEMKKYWVFESHHFLCDLTQLKQLPFTKIISCNLGLARTNQVLEVYICTCLCLYSSGQCKQDVKCCLNLLSVHFSKKSTKLNLATCKHRKLSSCVCTKILQT